VHTTKTLPEPAGEQSGPDDDGQAVPGVVLIFTRGMPVNSALALEEGKRIIGRDTLGSGIAEDPTMSRSHAEVRWDGEGFAVRDLGSRNGTVVDGNVVRGQVRGTELGYLRAGTSLFLLRRDIRPFRSPGIERVDELILGPGLTRAWRAISRLARAGSNIFLHGETGSGKERAVQAFHALGVRSAGPLVAVNCSAIPETMAERLLFGTRRGAYSGAAVDAVGNVQTADGGVLFLDEVAELDLGVQAKLLRVLETREVMPLGANQPRKVDFQLCAATHRDLRAEVARGRFRQDLYFRISSPEVRLPPLRERIEEIPWFVDMAISQSAERALTIRPSFIEACLQRPWPGNVRELLAATRTAVHQALAQDSETLEARHLAPAAGQQFKALPAGADHATGASIAGPGPDDVIRNGARASPDREVLEQALREHHGNVTATARALGVHRTQLRRWLRRGSENQ
jgi:transcriptional regulator with PAS, ATPase and Fis domain